MMGLIGGELVTSVVLLMKLYQSHFKVWGVVITIMRLMHVFIAISVIATISGPVCLRRFSNFTQLLDRDHMVTNPKMYALASAIALIDINALILLPWRDSPFARGSFGLPNMALFRIVQFTSIFTAIVTVVSQVPYVDSTSNSKETDGVDYFFYANMAAQGVKAFVALLAYCIMASLLHEKDTADITTETMTSMTEAVAKSANMLGVDIEEGEGDIELRESTVGLHDDIPNPLQQAGAALDTKSAAHAFTFEKKQHATQKELEQQVLEMQRQMQEQQQQQQQMEEQQQQQVSEMQKQMQQIQEHIQQLLMMQTQHNQASQGE
jgi:hypothetical protein